MQPRRPFSLLLGAFLAAATGGSGAAPLPSPLAPSSAAAATPPGATEAAPAAAVPAPVSLSARKIYEQARSQLVQIRTVLKGRASQTSVGSGFFVSARATSSPTSMSSARRRSSRSGTTSST